MRKKHLDRVTVVFIRRSVAADMTEESSAVVKDLTKGHYVQKSEREKCHNESCGATFVKPSLTLPHHCRRCGEIFCMPCLKLRRRLNTMAQPDPDGLLCKVCLSCFEDEGPLLDCTKRSHTKLFQQSRKQTTQETYEQRIRVDILKECQRLLRGFKSSTSGFETVNTVSKIKSHFRIPNWQKSTCWTLEEQASMCRYCEGKLAQRKNMRNCKVCGLALCKPCSHKELLLYFEDGTRQIKTAEARLAIIRFTGCPDTEPRCSMLLYCCKECREEIKHRQVKDDTWYLENRFDAVSEIVRMDDKFQELTIDIRETTDKLSSELVDKITNCRTKVETIHAEPRTDEMANKEEQLQALKKRLHVRLGEFWKMFQELQSVIKENNENLTGKKFEFVKNYISARNKFYIETRNELDV